MKSKLMLAALALLMTGGAVHAEALLDQLYNAYRYYGVVQYCHTIREGYVVVYVNDVEFDRAHEKIKSIEAELLPKINAAGPRGGNYPNEQAMFKKNIIETPNKLGSLVSWSLDTEALWRQAIGSVKGTPISRDGCQQVLGNLMSIPSSGGNVIIKKDF